MYTQNFKQNELSIRSLDVEVRTLFKLENQFLATSRILLSENMFVLSKTFYSSLNKAISKVCTFRMWHLVILETRMVLIIHI